MLTNERPLIMDGVIRRVFIGKPVDTQIILIHRRIIKKKLHKKLFTYAFWAYNHYRHFVIT